MTFVEAVRNILFASGGPMTPQEIRDAIKKDFPEFCGTSAHVENVRKGHYKDIDHALLAQIYTIIHAGKEFYCDKTSKPMTVSLQNEGAGQEHWGTEARRAESPLPRPSRAVGYEGKISDILENAEKYHQAFYKANTFRGPSLYFHQRALETRKEPLSLTHLEYIYATLSSWGMHRMGRKGSKMQSFEVFRQSIEALRKQISDAQRFDLREMDEQKWLCLEQIFRGVSAMASGTSIVGNSKVMHHMLPNIIPPIDREYTLWFLRGNTNVRNDLAHEWQAMKDIISGFFIPVASDIRFRVMADQWMTKMDKFPWDTSYLKIVDNLIIGLKNNNNTEDD